jgi:uncharacterized damage-inducible protein DinB
MNRYFIMITLAASLAGAQTLTGDVKSVYGIAKTNVLKAADKMPEASYAFKPSNDVRSFGEIVGHVADSQYLFCSAVKGEPKGPDSLVVEKTKKTKTELVAALKEAIAYCDAVYDSLTDATAAEKAKFFGNDRTKLGLLSFNNAHTMEHYGNLATYMRIRGLVPPSSEGR